MKKKAILLIINSKSGKRKALEEREEIEQLLETRGTLITYHTNGKNDVQNIYDLKKDNPEIELAVVCGGDGTLNISLSALHHFHDVKFIFLPYGSVNIFARENHYPDHNIDALREILSHGKERTIYPGYTKNRAFILMASMGFDSYLVSQVEQKGKRFRHFSYVYAFIKYAIKYNFKKQFKISVGGEILTGNFVIISNCKKYGGFLEFTPRASFFKDEFEVFAYRGKSFFSILYVMILAFLKKHLRHPRVSYAYGKKIIVEGEGFSQMDGEIGDKMPFEIKKDKGVQFVLPA